MDTDDEHQAVGPVDNTGNLAQTQGDNSPVIQDSFNTAADRPELKRSWLTRPSAPRFRMSPGIDPQLNAMLNTFSVEAPVQPAQIEARWSGVGIDMDWVTPMPQNQVGKYQMKPVRINPTAPEDTVVFEVRFYLDDGQHGGKWQWPMKQHPKGHWVLEAHLGSHVHQPKPEDVWGPTAA